eukprot:TRINITY_DN426_c0_g1_i1.p1 TRINITY_DN426_c0_g1~~TRINITY_DN426_c0_g1_i1.p1  ORF type:complete len:225 (+),score=22.54 TRINITY_DN426_c0_g1_i1:593-1267(+)
MHMEIPTMYPFECPEVKCDSLTKMTVGDQIDPDLVGGCFKLGWSPMNDIKQLIEAMKLSVTQPNSRYHFLTDIPSKMKSVGYFTRDVDSQDITTFLKKTKRVNILEVVPEKGAKDLNRRCEVSLIGHYAVPTHFTVLSDVPLTQESMEGLNVATSEWETIMCNSTHKQLSTHENQFGVKKNSTFRAFSAFRVSRRMDNVLLSTVFRLIWGNVIEFRIYGELYEL